MMAPFSSMLKSKSRRKHRPPTPPSPGSFVSPRSPNWHQSSSFSALQDDVPSQTRSRDEWTMQDYMDNSVIDIRDCGHEANSAGGPSRNGGRHEQLQHQVDPHSNGNGLGLALQRPATAPPRTSSEYDDSRQRMGVDLHQYPQPAARQPTSAPRARPPSTTLNVAYGPPLRDSVMSSEGSMYSSSGEVHTQIMSFAFPLPPASPATANERSGAMNERSGAANERSNLGGERSGGERERMGGERPTLPPLPKFNLGRYPSWEELGVRAKNEREREREVEVSMTERVKELGIDESSFFVLFCFISCVLRRQQQQPHPRLRDLARRRYQASSARTP